MARYQHIKVFKDFYDFSLEMLSAIRGFPRVFKFTLGRHLQENAYNCLELIVYANSLADKRAVLEKAIIKSELLQIQLRLAKDMQCFNNLNVYLRLSQKLNEISKQLEGWKRSF